MTSQLYIRIPLIIILLGLLFLLYQVLKQDLERKRPLTLPFQSDQSKKKKSLEQDTSPKDDTEPIA